MKSKLLKVSILQIQKRKFIRKLPGITIKSYGGSAGISSISIDGGTSTHTKILVDGFDLTNVQNGQMDISQLPAPFIKSIHYIAYDINKYGSGSIDGVVDFKPWTNSNSVTLSYGSFWPFFQETRNWNFLLQKHFCGYINWI